MNEFPKQAGKYEKNFDSIKKIGLALFFLFSIFGLAKIQGTRSSFLDTATIEGIEFSAGYWIPEIHMSVKPAEPDGKKGFYKTTPCVTLSADIHGEEDGIDIFYEFSDDGNPIKGGEKYEGECVEIPDGDPTHFQAQAVNEENDDWKSEVISADFKVKTGASAGDVVINEIMWMGSDGDPDDEWIELRNMTEDEIDLSGWNIQQGGKGKGEGQHIEIPNGYTIEGDGYFLIMKKKWDKTAIKLDKDLGKDEGMTNVSGMDLDDDGEQLVLTNKNKNGLVIDTANGDGKWFAGEKSELLMQSMERKDSPKDGTKEENWKTCADSECNSGDYWIIPDGETGKNYGTPMDDNI